MEYLFKFLNNIAERLFNKHTPKGLSALIVALLLQYMGASDSIIETALKYNLTFIVEISSIFHKHIYYVYIISIILIMLGGFYVFKRNYYTIRLNSLELDLKHLSIEYEKQKMELEIEKLQFELEEIKANKIQDIKLLKEIATEIEIEKLKKELILIKSESINNGKTRSKQNE